MLTQDEILEFLTSKKHELKERFSVEKIGVFGSFSRNEATPKSDVDILIELADKTEQVYEKKRALRCYLEDQFELPVDIAREKYLNRIFREQILEEVKYA